MNVSLPVSPDQSLAVTLERVERVVWAVLFAVWALFLAGCIAGAFVVSAQPLSPAVAALGAACLVGTGVFVVADIVLG